MFLDDLFTFFKMDYQPRSPLFQRLLLRVFRVIPALKRNSFLDIKFCVFPYFCSADEYFQALHGSYAV